MMRGLCFSLIGLCALIATPLHAQSADVISPDQAKMGLYLGVWNYKAHGTETPFQKASDWYGTLNGEWFPGHYAVIRHNVMTGPSGVPSRIEQMLTFDHTRGQYRLFEVTEDGFIGNEDVTISGQSIMARHDQIIRGRLWHMRWTLTLLDQSHRRYIREYSSDGVTWAQCWISEESRG
jgi:hypothetical protein